MSYLTAAEKEKAAIEIYTKVYAACIINGKVASYAKQTAECSVKDLKKEFAL